jgi:hypothetical protein
MTDVTDVGPGDYVKIGSRWKEIKSNSEQGKTHPQRDGNWTVTTTDGQRHSGWGINAYAKSSERAGE